MRFQHHVELIYIYIYIYVYIYIHIHIYTQVICTTMDNTNRQAVKTDLIHKQVMRPLRHGGSHFVKLTIGIIHETMVVHMT